MKPKIKNSSLKCIVCGKNMNHKDIQCKGYSRAINLQFTKCKCGHITQNPIPQDVFLRNFYGSKEFLIKTNSKILGFSNYFSEEKNKKLTAGLRKNLISNKFRNIFKNKVVFKFGCGTGYFLYLLKNISSKAFGCDYSPLRDYGVRKYNVNIIKKNFYDIKLKKIDIFIFFNVFENINNLNKFFDKLNYALKKDGFIIFNSFDMNSLLAKILGRHYTVFRPPISHLFTKNNLKKFLKKKSYTVVSTIPDIRYFSLSKILSLFNIKFIGNFLIKYNIDPTFKINLFVSKIYICKRI